MPFYETVSQFWFGVPVLQECYRLSLKTFPGYRAMRGSRKGQRFRHVAQEKQLGRGSERGMIRSMLVCHRAEWSAPG